VGVEVLHRLQARSARHVLHGDARLPGDMAADVPGENAGIGIVAATRGRADHDGDRLELDGRLRLRRVGYGREHHRHRYARPWLAHRLAQSGQATNSYGTWVGP